MVNSNVNQAFEILFDAPEVCETEVREAVKKFRQKNEQSSNTKSNASQTTNYARLRNPRRM